MRSDADTAAYGYPQITSRVESGIATVVLDRPERMNPFTGAMMTELVDAYSRADADDGVRVVVVTGRGQAFCAGADLGNGATSFDMDDPSRAVGTIGGVPRDSCGVASLAAASCRSGDRGDQRSRGRGGCHHDA
jgi:hypothetical protein